MARVIIVCAIACATTLAGSLLLAQLVAEGKRQTLEEALAWQSEHYDTSFLERVRRSAYTVTAPDGYVLHAELLAAPKHTGRYVIISHGYTDNRMGALKYARLYLDMGISCIIWDLRGHGENEHAPATYTIREGPDLAALVADTRERYDDLTLLGAHGESLGAATTLAALARHPALDWVVADCPFADIEGVLRAGYRSAGVPEVAFDLANLGMRLRYGTDLTDARPIDALADNQVPIMFVHGADDELITPDNTVRLMDATAGRAELHLVEGAGHAESVLVAPEHYRAWLDAYLSSVKAGRDAS